MCLLNDEHIFFPDMAGVARYHHHLKFHFIDRRWNSRDVATTTDALMIAERHRDGIHQFAHGFASKSSQSDIHSDHFLPSFFEGQRAHVFSLRRDSEAFLMTVDSTLLITARPYKSAWFFDPDELSFSRDSHTESFSSTLSWVSRASVLFCPCYPSNIDKERRKYSYFHDGGSIVSRISIAMCAGRGSFQDQDIVYPRSPFSFHDSLVTLRLTPAALAFYCQVTILAWITSVIHIFIAEINVWE